MSVMVPVTQESEGAVVQVKFSDDSGRGRLFLRCWWLLMSPFKVVGVSSHPVHFCSCHTPSDVNGKSLAGLGVGRSGG